MVPQFVHGDWFALVVYTVRKISEITKNEFY